MSPSELLIRAADLIRDTAAAAKDGPWRNQDTFLAAGRATATVLEGEGNKTRLVAWLPSFEENEEDGDGQFRKALDTARWIALMSPAVADWQEQILRNRAAVIQWADSWDQVADIPERHLAEHVIAVLGEKEESNGQ